MKKLIYALIFVAICLGFLPAMAHGEIVGYVYSTDIMAYVNGIPVPSYNIGGKTAVVIEDLEEYYCGFYYDYEDYNRTLKAEFFQYDGDPEKGRPSVERGRVEKIVGEVYSTDIKVFVNGSEITGYNIGGRTAVAIEDLGAFDGLCENERYGYSKYLCNFVWNDEERTVSLNAVEGKYVNSFMEFNVPAIKFLSNDNILAASYDPMNDYYSDIYAQDGWTYVQTEEFKSKQYILHPLYLDINGTRTDIGLCYPYGRHINEDGIEFNYTAFIVRDADALAEMLRSLVENSMAYEDILKRFNDGTNYKTLDCLETEDYMFIVVQDLKSEDDIYYISAAKEGGYYNLGYSSKFYTERILEKTDVNTVDVTVSPFAGPHGASSMRMTFELEMYDCMHNQ